MFVGCSRNRAGFSLDFHWMFVGVKFERFVGYLLAFPWIFIGYSLSFRWMLVGCSLAFRGVSVGISLDAR